jgi:hypothetical protein
MKAVASASVVETRCGDGFGEGFFNYKKGEWLNPLKSLNPKRQIQTVNRQECAFYRQKGVAFLSFVCQCPVC